VKTYNEPEANRRIVAALGKGGEDFRIHSESLRRGEPLPKNSGGEPPHRGGFRKGWRGFSDSLRKPEEGQTPPL